LLFKVFFKKLANCLQMVINAIIYCLVNRLQTQLDKQPMARRPKCFAICLSSSSSSTFWEPVVRAWEQANPRAPTAPTQCSITSGIATTGTGRGTMTSRIALSDAENPQPELCDQQATQEALDNEDRWLACLDDMPMVSEDCRMQLNHADPEQDTDGDGISDYMESWMSLNPCERCSYGGVEGVNCDSDEDFDGDGTPNGQDNDPGCSSEGGFRGCFF